MKHDKPLWGSYILANYFYVFLDIFRDLGEELTSAIMAAIMAILPIISMYFLIFWGRIEMILSHIWKSKCHLFGGITVDTGQVLVEVSIKVAQGIPDQLTNCGLV